MLDKDIINSTRAYRCPKSFYCKECDVEITNEKGKNGEDLKGLCYLCGNHNGENNMEDLRKIVYGTNKANYFYGDSDSD